MHCTLEVFFKFCSPALHFIFCLGVSGDDLGERAEMGGRGGGGWWFEVEILKVCE